MDKQKHALGQNGAVGQYGHNGFQPAKVVKVSTVSARCFKCGKLKSEHKLFQGCPK